MQAATASMHGPSISSIYGFDDSIFGAGATMQTNDPWQPSAEAGSKNAMVQGSTRTVSAADRSAAGKGWFSCRVMVLAPPKLIICKPNFSGQQTTMVIAMCVLIDHPGDKEGVKINQSEFAWLENDGLTLGVGLIEKGQKDDGGVKRNVQLRFTNYKRMQRGSVFEFTVFGKDGLRDKSSNDRPCDFGDILRLNGITRELRPGKNNDPETGRPRLFPSINAKEAKHWLNLFDADAEERLQTHVYSTLFNWLVETIPQLIPMVIPEDVNYTKVLEAKRKKADEKKSKNPQLQQTPAQANAAKPAAAAATTPNQFLSKRPIVVPDANDEYQVEAEDPGLDEKKEAGDSALSGECKKFKWDNPDIFVPLHVVDPKVVQYMRLLKLPFTGYLCQPNGAFRIDPTQIECFRREKRPGKDDPKPADDAPKVYEPTFKFEKRVIQVKGDSKQEIKFEVQLTVDNIKWFGITDPQAQMDVLPYLAACTPAVARTWINGRFSAEKSDPSDPNKFTYVLVGVTKRGEPPVPQVGLIADVACGVVSAGYRVTAAAACELLNVLGKRPEYADPKAERQVSADMTDRRIRNKYARGNQADLNKINTVAQNAPVVNCCESTDNWLTYGHDYHFYIVSNWAEKNFQRYPTLKGKIASFGTDPTEAFSKIFLQIAKEGTLPAELVEFFGPAHPADKPRPALPSKMDYVIFAIRKDYAEKRGLDKYHGDNAFADVVSHCEDYLTAWSDKLKLKLAAAPLPAPKQPSLKKPVLAPTPPVPKTSGTAAAAGAAPPQTPGTKRKQPESATVDRRPPPADDHHLPASDGAATEVTNEIEMKETEEDGGEEDDDEEEEEEDAGENAPDAPATGGDDPEFE